MSPFKFFNQKAALYSPQETNNSIEEFYPHYYWMLDLGQLPAKQPWYR